MHSAAVWDGKRLYAGHIPRASVEHLLTKSAIGSGFSVLATRQLLQLRGIARAMQLDCRKGGIDLRQILGGQLDGGGLNVLVQALEPACSGNGNYPGLLRQEPCQSQLAGCHLPSAGEPPQQLNQIPIGPPRVRGKAGREVAVIIALKGRVLIDRPGEKPTAQWAEGNKTDAELLESG